jgi:hypothetical protein
MSLVRVSILSRIYSCHIALVSFILRRRGMIP